MEKIIRWKNPIQIVNNLHNYDDDWNYPQQ